MTKEILLSRGYVALVDDADFEELNRYKWRANGEPYVYASRNIRVGGRAHAILMHRVILGIAEAGRHVYGDHVNRDTLDNRRANLRITNNKGNQGNRKMQGGTSRYRGVSWFARDRKWRAAIRVNRVQMNLGYFHEEKVAAQAYNVAALRHFGEFATLNIIDE